MIRSIVSILIALVVFGCAADENTQPDAPVIQMDEDGVPLACDLMVDTFLMSTLSNAASLQSTSEKLENNQGQKCQYQLYDTDDSRMGQIILIAKEKQIRVNRSEIAKRAMNTEYISDLEFPATWRSFPNLYTFEFEHGEFTISMNLGNFKKLDNKALLEKAKELARHIDVNLSANGI